MHFLSKHPQIGKKWVQSLKIGFFSICFHFYYRGLSKTQWFRKWKWHFSSKWSWKSNPILHYNLRIVQWILSSLRKLVSRVEMSWGCLKPWNSWNSREGVMEEKIGESPFSGSSWEWHSHDGWLVGSQIATVPSKFATAAPPCVKQCNVKAAVEV